MALFEQSAMPGAPYFLASLLSVWALLFTFDLGDSDKELQFQGQIHDKDKDQVHPLLLDSESDFEDVH
jgi:hypothetical protein